MRTRLWALLAALALPLSVHADTLVVDAVDDLGAPGIAALRALTGLDLDYHSPASRAYGTLVAEGDVQEVVDAVRALRGHPLVEVAEPSVEWRVQVEVPTVTPVLRSPRPRYDLDWLRARLLASLGLEAAPPDDPLYGHQWHMRAVGAEEAWEHATGEGVVVAVIDTGVAFEDYRDFKRMKDLDQTRFVEGYDVLGRSPHANDQNSHGTHVAGTIAQSTDNGFGVVGLARGAAIMPVRVLTATGAGTTAGIADGIRWAADHGADVINLSLGAHVPSKVVEEAVRHAAARGVIVVAAAGNSGRRGVAYPAAYEGVVAVSATDLDGRATFYTSYGPQVTLAAPGGDVRADRDGDGMPDGVLQNTFPWRKFDVVDEFRMFMGTSMASPHVAATAALLVEVLNRQDVPREERLPRVLAALEQTAATPPGGPDAERYGAGILDAAAAVRSLLR